MTWTKELLSTIPDDVLFSEWQRRKARKRTSYSGGAVWAKHNPNTARCRCAACNAIRTEREVFAREAGRS